MQDQQEGTQQEKHVVNLTAPHYVWRQLNLGGQQNCGTKETKRNKNMSKQKSRKIGTEELRRCTTGYNITADWY